MKSLFQASALLKQLKPEQKKVFSKKALEGNKTAAEWLTSFDQLNHVADLSRSAFRWGLLFCAVGVAVAIGGLANQNAWLIGTGIVIFLAIGITSVVRFSGKRVHRHLRYFAIPVLQILNEDTEDTTPIALKLDMRDICIKSKQRGKRSVPRRDLPAGVTGRKEFTYANPWISLTTKLVDGSRIAIHGTDQVLKRDTTKRSISGKTKFKVKYKSKQLLTLRLRPPSDAYRWNAEYSITTEPACLPQGLLVWRKSSPGKPDTLILRSERRKVSVAEPWKDTLDPAVFIKQMDAAQQIVQPPEAVAQT